MKTFLDMMKTFTRNYTQEELAEELTILSKDLDPDKPKKYTHSTISKLLNGRQPFTRRDVDYIIELLSLTKDEKKQLIELFPIYEYEYHLKPKEVNDIKAILRIFESFQKLCVPTLPLTLQKDLEITAYPDGIYDSEIEIHTAIYQTLCNEFQKEKPRIDVFLPQNFEYYYRQLKILLPDAGNKENISIRQILMYSNSKNSENNGEFDLLKFLPTIYYLTFVSSGNYVFYYHYTDSVISEIDGLLYPYYICTSDCLIRLSQHQRTAWVSHNLKDVEAYQIQFDKRIKKTRPLMRKYSSIVDYIDSFTISESLLNDYYSPAICPIKLISSDFDIASLIKSEYYYPKNDLLFKIQEFMQMVIMPCEHYHYYSGEGLYEFAETGILREYPEDMFFPVPPKSRIEMLNTIFNNIKTAQKASSKYNYYIINDNFPRNSKYCLGVSNKCVVSYALGFENLETSIITNPMLVNKFKFFFEEYLPKSELVYSREKTLEIVQSAIKIAKSKL